MSMTMGIGVDLDDLGIDLGAPTTAPAQASPQVETVIRGGALIPGEPLAQVLYQVWSGREVIIVPSPPGAGKSTLLARLVAHLVPASGMRVGVVTPTRRSAIELANKLGNVLGCRKSGDPYVALAMKLNADESELLNNRVKPANKGLADVVVSTIASAVMSGARDEDVLVVDEAYQAVFSDVAAAAENSPQIVLVGDPGQIGPVVTANTSVWEGARRAPHRPAPEVFMEDGDPYVVTLTSTFRVGVDAVKVLAPLYDFPFDSKRPERYVLAEGNRVPELRAMQVPFAAEFDTEALSRVAAEAIAWIGRDFVEHRSDGSVTTRQITPADIAIGVARSAQQATLNALLRAAGTEASRITVGTADSLQGGQWPVFIGVDPLAGADTANEFRTSPGRLCVLLSRHMGHLTWIHDGRWEQLLTDKPDNPAEAARGYAVRETLIGDQ